MQRFYLLIITLCSLAYLQSCKYDKIALPTEEEIEAVGYPQEIGAIFLASCAVEGCHTTNDMHGAGGLDLSSWDALFRGARNGSPVVPFRADYSFMCYFINTYTDLGPIAVPTMPLNPPALSHEQVELIQNWINDGALSNLNTQKFENIAGRKKIYIANSGCDEVAVMDAESRQIMRYISVGDDATNEKPHTIRISPDGSFWCLVFRDGKYLQKFSTLDDSPMGQAFLGDSEWNSVAIAPDGIHAFVTDYISGPGARVVHVNLQTMTVTSNYTDVTLNLPHGTYYMRTDSFLYVTSEGGHRLFKFDFHGDPDFLFNNGSPLPIQLPLGSIPHEIIFTPDESKYFVTCAGTDQVLVFNTANDSLLNTISVGDFPQEMAIYAPLNYLLITCQEDVASPDVQPNERGSVYIYNYNTGQQVPIAISAEEQAAGVIRCYQPHGIAVDETSKLAFVASLNTLSPLAPHHPSGCTGRNGFMTAIQLDSVPQYLHFNIPDLFITYLYKSEILVYPYSVMAK